VFRDWYASNGATSTEVEVNPGKSGCVPQAVCPSMGGMFRHAMIPTTPARAGAPARASVRVPATPSGGVER
jgi:hypothetical protein